jgi:hypothetical protein
VDGRGKTRKNERVKKEDRAEDRRRADQDVARVGTERRLEHAAAERTAKAALFRLLEHNDHRQKDADQDFDYIEKTDENRHFAFLSLMK